MIESKFIWNYMEYKKEQVKKISETFNISKTTAKLLIGRGITEPYDIERFLNPTLEGFYDPYLLKDMDKAVIRIIEVKNKHENITIYGDYDVDGITSTSILLMFLKQFGWNVGYYIPNRLEEGYGINNDAIKKIKERNTDLIITVDTGITAIEEIEYAKQLGMKVIITDHHEVQEEIPKALAIIDPKRRDCEYPFDMLAGVGVAFKLIHALALKLNMVSEIWKYLDIVAVGTVADIVPLIDENRIIVKNAFKTIPNTWNIGLKALLDIVDYKIENKITSGLIGYRIAPRLNAAGRLGDAKRGVELFTTDSQQIAEKIAKELNDENINRQSMEQKIFDEAVEIIEEKFDINKDKIIVVANENWHHGVIGIVASRITEKYYRPTIILCIEDDTASGSARSVKGFSIFEALNNNKQFLIKFGGHEMAAGLALKKEYIDEFRNKINEYAEKIMDNQILIPKLRVDAELRDEDIDLKILDEIEILQPFGMGNPEPVFSYSSKVKSIRTVGREQMHLKLVLDNGKATLDTIGFNMGQYAVNIIQDAQFCILGNLTKNEWNNNVKPQLILKDLKSVAKINSVNDIIPEREDFVSLYRLLVNWLKLYSNKIAKDIVISELKRRYNINSNEIKIKNCLEIFKELDLIEYEIIKDEIIYKIKNNKKVNLQDSKTYQKLMNIQN